MDLMNLVGIRSLLVSALCGLLAAGALALLAEYAQRFHIDLFHSLRYYTDRERPPQSLLEYPAVRAAISAVRWVAAHLPAGLAASRLDRRLRQAGLPLLGSEFLVCAGAFALGAGFVAYVFTLAFLSAAAAVLASAAAAWAWVLWRVRQRRERFVNQLGDCLTTVANALRAGFSFLQAMDLISREMEPPMSEEFAHVMRDISYGMPMEEALEDMEARVASPDFSLVVTAVIIQRQVGGNLAQVLDSISDTIMARVRMRREIKTITAQGRMSAWVLSLTPVVIAGAMLAIDGNYFDGMMENLLGKAILVVAVILEIIGFAVIQKIVNIKVD